MDALALLCNLYGDGPATLKRLRAGGVLCIEDLSEKPAGDLALLLSLPPTTARRFLKEASSLKKRVLETEEALEVSRPRAPTPRPARSGARGKEAILDAAARRWSELERSSSIEPVLPVQAEIATPPARVVTTALSNAEIDAATRAALENAGVRSLEELAVADVDTLAHAAGIGVSQVLFAQSLARKAARAPKETAEPRAEIVVEDLAVHILTSPRADARSTVEERSVDSRSAGAPVRFSRRRDDRISTEAGARFSPSEAPPAPWLSQGGELKIESSSREVDEGAGPFA